MLDMTKERTMDAPLETVTDERARRILAKAMEIHARQHTSLQELEIIAREVGVSREAFHAALEDDRGRDETAGRLSTSAWVARIIVAAGIPLGLAAGSFLTRPVFSHGAMPMFGIMTAGLAASATLIALERRHPAAHRFVFRNTMFWTGLAAGSLVAISMVGTHSAVELPWLHTTTAILKNWFYVGDTRRGCSIGNGIKLERSRSTWSEPVEPDTTPPR
jgi:hypothetical protein